MKAAVFAEHGEPAARLTVSDGPEPTLRRGQVLVRMLASPVNPADLLIVRGRHLTRPTLPATPGVEGVGIVEQSGGGLLGRMLVGKRVATVGVGAWREKHVVDAKQAIPVPAGLSDEQASMYFVNPATARLLTAGMPRGGWLIQTAAASAVGRIVIGLGKRDGFRTFNLVRRPEHAEELRKLGAEHVALESDDWMEQFTTVCGHGFAARALDPVGGPQLPKLLDALAPGGTLRVYGSLADAPAPLDSRAVVNGALRIEGFQLSRAMAAKSLLQKLRLLKELKGMAAAGLIATPVAKVFPLSEVVAAVAAAEAPGRSGKVVLRIGTA